MIKLGDDNTLPLLRLDDKGGWLDAGTYGEAFLPRRQLPANCQPGDEIAVFIYLDADLAPVVTTEKPRARVGQFASLKVVTTNRLGAFLDWGMKKDIFVPQRMQSQPMHEGRHYVVYLYLDHEGRMVASSKLDSFVSRERPPYQAGDEVGLLIAEHTQLGFKAIVDNRFWGLVFKSDVSGRVPTGLATRGYVKQVRDDGKLDLTLFKPGPGKVDDAAQAVLDKLAQSGGVMRVSDKTDPDTIFRLFGISKGTFKKAIGGLYKKGLIRIEEDGIRVAKE
ncbi:nucleotide-binding protein [Zobellella endophytica]|uniref:Nucleotide-binding protein n=1 Tax=Zobellella endophytica TaxID=2116700 RepID=A0A2P7R7J9_9GAMM|nr:S1-like domain-containing RNA-binding protein [Zobellella endophytica]PSJ46189.1 nucleotide-binding protein [Zobellella endophytica]